MNIIETELLRESLYSNILNFLSGQIRTLKFKEICHLLLRYIFNKNITKTEEDDPVFIISKSIIAETQLIKDFKYFKIKVDPIFIIKHIEEKLLYSFNIIKDTENLKDDIPKLKDNIIIYKDKRIVDTCNLAKNSGFINYALALNIRYKYMYLLNHGLARDYKNLGYKPTDGIEGFASAFNHYFDHFYSAFPDLETCFGSKGSFFNVKEIKEDTTVFINPPFDESLMTETMIHIYNHLNNLNDLIFIVTLPNWKDYPELEKFKVSKYVKKCDIYIKGKMPFIDYMNIKETNKIIYPCDICEIILSK